MSHTQIYIAYFLITHHLFCRFWNYYPRLRYNNLLLLIALFLPHLSMYNILYQQTRFKFPIQKLSENKTIKILISFISVIKFYYRVFMQVGNDYNNLQNFPMFDPTRYRYFLKPEKMGQLKTQFFRITCSRVGEQQHLTKTQLHGFLLKQGFEIKLANFSYYDRQLFKEDNKQLYNCNEAITLVDRLSINSDIQKEFKRVFKKMDIENKQRITLFQLKKTMNKCNNKNNSLSETHLNDIFNQLDIDQDGLVSFQDFLCAMISK